MTNVLSNGTRYGAPANRKAATPPAAKGRVCASPGCDTVLSTYNEGSTCSIHSEPSFRHAYEARTPLSPRR
jgi:hypothetical protein